MDIDLENDLPVNSLEVARLLHIEEDYEVISSNFQRQYEASSRSSQQQEQEESSQGDNFNEIDNILAQGDGQSERKQMILVMKNKQLQKICLSLTSANQKLIDKIDTLEDQLEKANGTVMNQNENEMEIFLAQITGQIEKYKQQFKNYRQKSIHRIAAKDIEIGKLKSLIRELTQSNFSLEDQLNHFKSTVNSLQKSNHHLLLQIQNLQNQLMQNHSQAPSSRVTNNRQTYFQNQIQYQLQKLIDKLMNELEFERGQKKKLTQEIKRMQNSIVELEKQIMSKNNKIYTLEINNLKSNRNQFKNGDRMTINDKTIKYMSPSGSKKNDQSKIRKSFSIKLLLNDSIQISGRQMFIIISKIIDFYLRKIINQDFNICTLQNLIVSNFSRTNINSVTIKNDQTSKEDADQEYLQTQQRLIWNLGFILDNIMIAILQKGSSKSDKQMKIMNIITNILDEKSCNINTVYELKKLVEQINRYKQRQ